MAKHNWPELKARFMGSEVGITAFLEANGLVGNNWGKYTKGWLDERKELQAKVVEKAKARQVNYLVRRSRMGRVLQVKAFRKITDKKLSRATLTELRGVIETGAKLEDSAFAEQTESTVNDLAGGVSVGLQIEGVDGKSIKLLANFIARSKAGLPTTKRLTLGD